ncbi:MAG TPA: FtsQ-type POTRA domain-containing protein [Puia sp.]|jgi:cell division protein FtsQ
MAVKINIKKIVSLTLWCSLGAGVLVLLVAAIGYRNNKTCKGYKIDIAGPSGTQFIDKKQILELLAGAGAGKIQHTPIAHFDLHRMEAALEKNVWIKDAELFFDNNEVLRINVKEREPIARVFTREGGSFYMDSSGMELPLSEKLTARLPVFTDYPGKKIRTRGQDSLLVVQMKELSQFLREDSFWMAQIAQLDVTPDRHFELVPTVGNHVIGFGDGSDYQEKFHRLFVFYKEVLSKTGFDKYSRIDVAYAGQVIGTHKGSEGTRMDSLQGMRNIQQMIRSAQLLQSDTIHQRDMRPLERPTQTEQTLTNYDLIPNNPLNKQLKK